MLRGKPEGESLQDFSAGVELLALQDEEGGLYLDQDALLNLLQLGFAAFNTPDERNLFAESCFGMEA